MDEFLYNYSIFLLFHENLRRIKKSYFHIHMSSGLLLSFNESLSETWSFFCLSFLFLFVVRLFIMHLK